MAITRYRISKPHLLMKNVSASAIKMSIEYNNELGVEEAELAPGHGVHLSNVKFLVMDSTDYSGLTISEFIRPEGFFLP